MEFTRRALEITHVVGNETLIHEVGHAMLAERYGNNRLPEGKKNWAPLRAAVMGLNLSGSYTTRRLNADALKEIADEITTWHFSGTVDSTLGFAWQLKQGYWKDPAMLRKRMDAFDDSIRDRQATGYTDRISGQDVVRVQGGQPVPERLRAEGNRMAREFLQLNPERGSADITAKEVVEHAKTMGWSVPEVP
jgi:hypothetical protein